MPKDLSKNQPSLLSIRDAATFLNVSLDTLRRWDKTKKLRAKRIKGERFYNLLELERVKLAKPLSITKAAGILKISPTTLRRLDSQGILKPDRTAGKKRLYTKDALDGFVESEYFLKRRTLQDNVKSEVDRQNTQTTFKNPEIDNKPTVRQKVIVAQEHENRQAIVRLFSYHRVITLAVLGFISFLILFVLLSAASFLLIPRQTAQFFGYVYLPDTTNATLSYEQSTNVLGDSTSRKLPGFTGAVGNFFQPLGLLSLNVAGLIEPSVKDKVRPATDANLLSLTEDGSITPLFPVVFPDSSYLTVKDLKKYSEINAKLLQGRIPGTKSGDIIYFGDENIVPGLTIVSSNIGFGAVNLASNSISGILGLSSGGTGSNLTLTSGGVVYAGSSVLAVTAEGNSGQPLLSGGSSSPTFGTLGLNYGGTNTNLSGAQTGGLLFMQSSAVSASAALSGIVQGNGSNGPSAITGSANYLPKWSSSAQYLTASSSLYDDGNVGIGTTTPGSALEVLGNIYANTGQIRIGNFSSSPTPIGSGALYFDTLSNELYYYNGSSWQIIGSGGSGGDSLFTLSNGLIFPRNSTADVAIGGTSTASAKFGFINVNSGTPTATVSGNITLDHAGSLQTTKNQSLTIGGNTTGFINLTPLGGSGTLNLNLGALSINGTAGVTIGTASCITTTNGIVTGSGSCPGGSGSSNWNIANGAIFPNQATVLDVLVGSVSTSSALVRLPGTTNQHAFFNLGTGNLGIGTTTPGAKLDVNGGFNVSGYATSSASLGVGNLSAPLGPGHGAFSGNLGIGTSNPAAVLDIAKALNGDLEVRINNSNSQSGAAQEILLGENFSSKYGFLRYHNTSGVSSNLSNIANSLILGTHTGATGGISIYSNHSTAPIRFATGGNNTEDERMRIDGNGNLGIGTTTPGARLHVQAASVGKALGVFNQTGVNNDILTASAAGTSRLSVTYAGGIRLGTNEGTNGNCIQSGGTGVAATWGSCVQNDNIANSYTVSVNGTTYYALSTTGLPAYTGTDLETVLESAVSSLSSAGGGNVLFQDGTYDFGTANAAFNTVNDIVFQGAGIDATIIQNNSDAASDTEPLSFTNSKRITIRDLTVHASGSARTSSDAIDFDQGDDVIVERVKVGTSRGRGIVIDGKDSGATADRGIIRDSIITGTNDDGIEILAGNNISIVNNKVYDTVGHGIQLSKASSGAGQPNKQSNYNIVSGNDVNNAGRDGININSSSYNIISNNSVTNSADDTSSRDGIRLESNDSISCNYNIIEGNVSTDNQGTKTQRYGINIGSANCYDNTISNNFVEGNNTASINDLGTNTRYSQYLVNNNILGVSGNVGIGTTTGNHKLFVGASSPNGLSLVGFNQTNSSSDIFTASASGISRFSLTYAGGIRLGTSEGSNGNCLLSGGTGAAATWGSCGGGSSSQWTAFDGAIFPNITSQDVLIGGSATSSAVIRLAGTSGQNSFLTGGNVGIGTSAPVRTLDVVGATVGRSLANFNQTGANNDILTASAAGTTRLRLDYSGNLTLYGQNSTAGNGNTLYGSDQSNGRLFLSSTSHSSKGSIYFFSSTNTITEAGVLTIGDDLTVNGDRIRLGGTTSSIDLAAIGTLTTLQLRNSQPGGTFLADVQGRLNVTSYATVAASLNVGGGTVVGGTGNINASGTYYIGGTAGQTIASASCVTTAGGIVTGSGACPSSGGGSANWTIANGAIFPNQASTLDLLVGGVSTQSAKFALLNMAGGTPTATVAGNFIVMPNTSLGAGGRLGIGTTAPERALDVNGDVRISNGDLLLAQRSSSPSTTEGSMYYDSDNDQVMVYANNKWQADRSTATVIVAASDSRISEKADFTSDGTDDDQTIESALAALPSTGGRVVLLDGTYNLSDDIDITLNDIEVVGQGRSTILNRTADGFPMIRLDTNDGRRSTFANFAISGQKATHTSTSNDGILGANTNLDVTIQNTYIHDNAGDGISMSTGNTGWKILGNTIADNGVNGVDGGVSDITVSGNTISGSGDNGIAVTADRATVSNNYVTTSVDDGIHTLSADDMSITGNTFYANGERGIYLWGTRASVVGNAVNGNGTSGNFDGIETVSTATNSTISNNTVTGSTDEGIHINADNVVVSGNTVTSSTDNGIEVGTSVDYATVDGNIVSSNGGIGIMVGIATTRNTIANNNIIANTEHGISLDNATFASITDNMIYNNGGSNNFDGISISASDDNQVTGNKITDTAGSGFAIDITSSTSDRTYLSNNVFSGTGATSINNSGTQTAFANQYSNSNNDLAFTPTGNVGIGTTAPVGKLNINGATVGKALTILNETGNQAIFTASSAGATRFVIANDGSVGIGTTAPALDLSNSASILATGAAHFSSIMGAGLVDDCDSSGSKLLWDQTTKTFSCGSDRATTYVRKSADESVNNVTLQDDDQLTFAIGASETWAFQIYVFYDTNGNATPDMKYAVTAPSGATCAYGVADPSSGPATGATRSTNTCGAALDVGASATGQRIGIVSGTIINSTNAGSVTLQWAQQNTDAVNATTVHSGSYLLGYRVSGADIAEVYYTHDASLQPGDVVSIDTALPKGVRRSNGAYDKAVLGVITTQPGLVIGDEGTAGIPALVGLSGRIPVRVTSKNGPIQPGDYLTSSSIPGVASKQSNAGQSIGRALAYFDEEGEGSVLMFIENTWHDPIASYISDGSEVFLERTDSDYILTTAFKDAIKNRAAFSEAVIAKLSVGTMTVQDINIEGNLLINGKPVAGLNIQDPKDKPSIVSQSEAVKILESMGKRRIELNLGAIGEFSLVGKDSQDIATIDQDGNASIAGMLSAKKIKADEIDLPASVWAQALQAGGLEIITNDIKRLDTKTSSLAALLAVTVAPQETLQASSASNTMNESADSQKLLDLKTPGVFPEVSFEGQVEIDKLLANQATISGSLRVKESTLIERLLTVIDTIMTRNLIVSGLATFFESVVFKNNVRFEGKTTFNKDTAGVVTVKKGEREVRVEFSEPYETTPVINITQMLITPSIKSEQNKAREEIFSEQVQFVTTDQEEDGFTLLLKNPAKSDLTFSWISISATE